MKNRIVPLCLSLVTGLCLATPARSEGSAQQGGSLQLLQSETVMYLDILDADMETFDWNGTGALEVTDPEGNLVGNYPSGSTISPVPGLNGAYRLALTADQTASGWDVTVYAGGQPRMGRLYSREWHLDGLGLGVSDAADASLYALVHGGTSGLTEVVEIRYEGMAGFVYRLFASDVGVGEKRGMSASVSGNSAQPFHPLYVNPPEIATFSSMTPVVSDFGFTPSFASNSGVFFFTTDIDGIYHITCDLNSDGVLDSSHPDDRLLLGRTIPGVNRVLWDARDRFGAPLIPDVYDCNIIVNLGEVHFVSEDIETAYPGIRMFRVNSNLTRTGLEMFWNDTLVMAGAVMMPNGQFGLEYSGVDGIYSSSYAEPTLPNVNARAWGNFTSAGRGNSNLLDTFSWIGSGTTTSVGVEAQDRLLEVAGLVAESVDFTWDTLDGATAYDVIRGDLSTLRSSMGDYTSAVVTCSEEDTTGTSTPHGSIPVASGEALWWLVRAVNGAGDGTYDALAFEQSAPRDTGIAASMSSCN